MAAIDPAARKRGLTQERKEHPTLPMKVTERLVDDHLAKYGNRAYPKKHR